MPTQLPLVSVIIPAYNARGWIGPTIDSALNQTYPNIEIIVVDDGSQDRTAAYLKERYGDKIRLFEQANGGPSKARNTALAKANGEFIAFLDSDDLFLPEKIERQVNFLQTHPEYGVTFCAYWCVFDNDLEHLHELDYQRASPISGDILPQLLERNVAITSTYLFRKECFEQAGVFWEELDGFEDWDLWVRISGLGFQFGYIGDKLAIYRIRGNSLSHRNLGMRLNRYRYYAHAKATLPPERLNYALAQAKEAASFEFGVARALFEKKQYRAGFRQVGLALKTSRRHRLIYSLFCLIYVLAMLLLGYERLEKLVSWLADHILARFFRRTT